MRMGGSLDGSRTNRRFYASRGTKRGRQGVTRCTGWAGHGGHRAASYGFYVGGYSDKELAQLGLCVQESRHGVVRKRALMMQLLSLRR
ncbi:hypothetical protein BCR44DRAFT_1429432 [Catenaria anguillulae PL171]|uniref:Uncharacterized protein n=1 Tax=Catenaria anguillulae PL171 TaxID=765915 RepID=A0A1Y2HWE5_9FUNG|nr:hypothetical protein BCR44DRAFT_1429432 [Catenaria anguillulae PL171]